MPTLQNGQTHSNNSSGVADKLFECVWPFCGIGALRVRNKSENAKSMWSTNLESLLVWQLMELTTGRPGISFLCTLGVM